MFIQTTLEPHPSPTYLTVDVKTIPSSRDICPVSMDCVYCDEDEAHCTATEAKEALEENAYDALNGVYAYGMTLNISCRPAMAFKEGNSGYYQKSCNWDGTWDDQAETIPECECEDN